MLRDVFGYGEFRPGQAEVIAAVLEGRDTLAVMPTGGGKSICYQVPALLQREGITLVVSPLLALMKDQVDGLKLANYPAAALYSGMSGDELQSVRREGRAWEIALGDGVDPGAAIGAVAAAVPAARIELRRPTLEDVFVGIVAEGEGGQEARDRLRAAVRDEAGEVQS